MAAWGIALLVSMVLVAGLLGGALTSEGTVTNNPESLRAEKLIDDRLGEDDPVDEVVVIRSNTTTVSAPVFRNRVQTLAAEARRSGAARRTLTYLDRGGAALVSRDRHAAIVAVTLAEEQADHVEKLIDAVQRADGPGGFQVKVTGEYTVGRDFTEVSAQDLQKGELQFGLPAAMVVLLIVFGTLVGAVIPLIMALLSIIVGLAIVALIGQAFELNLFITNMLVAMGLALGIDYSLFIVSRLREERARGAAHREAILNVASTATRAVVFSGITFALAMAGMLLVPDTTLRSLALGAIVVGLVSVVIALTFHPALLMVLGDRVNRLRVPWLGRRVAMAAGREGRFWGALVRAVMRRPALSLLVATVAMLAVASPILGMKLGAAGSESLPESTIAKQGLKALERDFPSGATDPVDIVVRGASADPAARTGLARLRERLGRDRDFAVRGATVRTGDELTVLSLPLAVHPTSERASAAVDRLRERYVPAAFGSRADSVLVGGAPAENVDYFDLIGRWLPIVIAFVLALSVIVLTLAFRSLVVPLTAIAVNLLSVGAAYGLLVVVFQDGLGADLFGFGEVPRIESWVPVFLFSVLFGLSMDYQVFLLSRIHERYRQSGDTRDGIVYGVGSTARLITGAALIIVVVFAGFATGELVAFQQMGFGVAVALLIDATLVRSVVIPAAMALLGDRNWYLPGWLRWLPDVRIESSAPRRAPERPGGTPVPGEAEAAR